MIAVFAGLGTWIAVNILLGALRGLACGMSQFMNVLLRFSVFALPIRIALWFASAWAGMSVFDAMGGL